MACTGGLDRPILVGALVFYSSPVMPGVRPGSLSAMQQRKRKMRAVFVVGVAVIAILTCSILVSRWKRAADQEDMSTTNHLLGRWGTHHPGSPASAPPLSIYEFLPDGLLAIYQPDGRLISDQNNIRWSIRRGDLLCQVYVHIPKNDFIPEDIHSKNTDRLQLEWDDEDTVRVQVLKGTNSDQFILRRRSTN